MSFLKWTNNCILAFSCTLKIVHYLRNTSLSILVLVAVMKSKELKTNTSHTHSLILSLNPGLSICSSATLTHSLPLVLVFMTRSTEFKTWRIVLVLILSQSCRLRWAESVVMQVAAAVASQLSDSLTVKFEENVQQDRRLLDTALSDLGPPTRSSLRSKRHQVAEAAVDSPVQATLPELQASHHLVVRQGGCHSLSAQGVGLELECDWGVVTSVLWAQHVMLDLLHQHQVQHYCGLCMLNLQCVGVGQSLVWSNIKDLWYNTALFDCRRELCDTRSIWGTKHHTALLAKPLTIDCLCYTVSSKLGSLRFELWSGQRTQGGLALAVASYWASSTCSWAIVCVLGNRTDEFRDRFGGRCAVFAAGMQLSAFRLDGNCEINPPLPEWRVADCSWWQARVAATGNAWPMGIMAQPLFWFMYSWLVFCVFQALQEKMRSHMLLRCFRERSQILILIKPLRVINDLMSDESAFRRGGCLGVSRVSRITNFRKSFQKTKTRRENQKTKSVRSSCIHFVSNLIFSCSIDRVLQMLNFPHLSIHQEVFTIH